MFTGLTVYGTLTGLFVKLEQGRFIHYLLNPTTEVVGCRLVTPFLFTQHGGILYQFKQLILGHMAFSFGLNNIVNKGTRMALTGPGSTCVVRSINSCVESMSLPLVHLVYDKQNNLLPRQR